MPVAREGAAAGYPGILLVAEELDRLPDEAYTKFSLLLEKELGRRRPLVVHITRAHRWSDRSGALRILYRTLEVARAARRTELRHARPEVVVYASRSSVTLPALFRARLLRLLCRTPVALVALQATGETLQGRMVRWLVPDLLLLPTEQECLAARRLGIRAECVWSGVDLERFRPARPGEKQALRQKWGLPADRRITLHVGHLKQNRNLQALVPLARADGVVMLVVASGRRGPESEALQAELEGQGVVVLSGFLPQVEEVYRLADCYVFPTVAQDNAVALPMSVLEALASDLPVVSTRFGALAERLGEAPGLELVDSPEEVAPRALALAGREVQTRALAEPFSWQAVFDRLMQLLDEISVTAGQTEGEAGLGPT